MFSTSANVAGIYFQPGWTFCIFVVALILNVRQIIKWRRIKSPLSSTIKLMSFIRACVSLAVGIGYLLELIGFYTIQDRATIFARYLAPIYWPLLLIMPVFTLPRNRVHMDDEVLKARVEKVIIEILVKDMESGDGESN